MENDKVIRIIFESVQEVFAKMLSREVRTDGKTVVSPEGTNNFTAAIGFTGTWSGYLSIACAQDLAEQITAGMLGMENASVDPAEVRDAMGEMANMIGGRFKSLFGQAYNGGMEAFQMTIPTVVYGKSYKIVTPNSNSHIAVPFLTGNLPFLVKLELKEN